MIFAFALQIYAVASSAAVLGKLAVSEDTVVVLKNFDELRNDLSVSGGFNAEDVTTFISGSTVPLIQEFSQVMTYDFCSSSAPHIFKSMCTVNHICALIQDCTALYT